MNEDLDIPSTIILDVAGLPPARARLARLTVRRRVLEGQSIELGQHRECLVEAQGEVAILEARLASTVDAEAKGLLASMRNGAARAVSAIIGSPKADLQAELTAARHRGNVADAALVEIDKDIAKLRADIATVDARLAEAVINALREHASATVGAEYAETLESLRQLLTRLEAIAQIDGSAHDGRLAAELPGYRASGHSSPYLPVVVAEPDLKASIGSWWRLAAAWRADAHADPADHLSFPPLVDDPAAGVPYACLSQPERNFIDLRHAGLT